MNKFLQKAILFLATWLILFRLSAGAVPLLPLLLPPVPAQAAEPAKATWREKWQETVTAAKKEGNIVVYTSSLGPDVRLALVTKIRDLFGINVDVVAVPSDQLTQKILTERQRRLYFADAAILGTQILSHINSGMLVPLQDALLIPEASDPKAWPNGKLPYIDKNGFTLALTNAYWSYILVNTAMVKAGELKSYADLIQPKWKGKIVLSDPSVGGTGVNWTTFMMRIMGPEKGEKYLRQLTTQDLMLTRDTRLVGEWVARGKYPVGIGPSMGTVTPLLKAGAPIAWVRMSEGGLAHPGTSVFVLMDKAPHPHAAKVFFNWLLTAEGQTIFSQAFGQPATRLGVSTEGLDPFTVPKPDEKVFRVDERFIIDVETKGRELGKEIFGHLSK